MDAPDNFESFYTDDNTFLDPEALAPVYDPADLSARYREAGFGALAEESNSGRRLQHAREHYTPIKASLMPLLYSALPDGGNIASAHVAPDPRALPIIHISHQAKTFDAIVIRATQSGSRKLVLGLIEDSRTTHYFLIAYSSTDGTNFKKLVKRTSRFVLIDHRRLPLFVALTVLVHVVPAVAFLLTGSFVWLSLTTLGSMASLFVFSIAHYEHDSDIYDNAAVYSLLVGTLSFFASLISVIAALSS